MKKLLLIIIASLGLVSIDKAQTNKIGFDNKIAIEFIEFYELEQTPIIASYFPIFYEYSEDGYASIVKLNKELRTRNNESLEWIEENPKYQNRVKYDSSLVLQFLNKDEENVLRLYSLIDDSEFGYSSMTLLYFIFDLEAPNNYFFRLKEGYDYFTENKDEINEDDDTPSFDEYMEMFWNGFQHETHANDIAEIQATLKAKLIELEYIND